ncbi:aristolochene synthase [Physcia stellaris]|nr:aristolochene synthase [Physcia stellaris]
MFSRAETIVTKATFAYSRNELSFDSAPLYVGQQFHRPLNNRVQAAVCAYVINLMTSTLSHLRIAMAPGTPGSQPAVSDGLQVIENPERAEKYPARRHEDPKFLTSTEDGALHLVAREHPLKQYKATQASRPRDGSARRRSRECKFWILLTILPLIIVGACVGGVLGSRAVKAHPNQFPTFTATTPSASSSAPLPAHTRSAAAYNGTSLAVVTYPHLSEANYLLFYQHSNGDLRKVVYNGSGWHKSSYVTNNARSRTGLSTTWGGEKPNERIYLYYIDKDDVLQELRGYHGSDDWTKGTLGAIQLRTAAPYSAVAAEFAGDCATDNNAFIYYQTSNGTLQEVLWNKALDSWTLGHEHEGVNLGSDFVTDLGDNIWRLYAVTTSSMVVQYECINCCTTYDISSDVKGIAARQIGQHILYYQSNDSVIRTLNNSGKPGNEKLEPDAFTLGRGMLGTKVAVADGSHLDQPIKAFYQLNGNDVTVTSWLPGDPTRNSTTQLSLEI